MAETVSEKLHLLLEEAIEIDRADMGNIQVLNASKGTLRIIAQKGFKADFLEHFKVVTAFDSSACGRAAGIGSTIFVSDVMQDLAFAPHREIAKSAGFRAVKSVPLISAQDKVIGMISTHFKKPRWSWETKKFNQHAQQIAQFLSNCLSERKALPSVQA